MPGIKSSEQTIARVFLRRHNAATYLTEYTHYFSDIEMARRCPQTFKQYLSELYPELSTQLSQEEGETQGGVDEIGRKRVGLPTEELTGLFRIPRDTEGFMRERIRLRQRERLLERGRSIGRGRGLGVGFGVGEEEEDVEEDGSGLEELIFIGGDGEGRRAWGRFGEDERIRRRRRFDFSLPRIARQRGSGRSNSTGAGSGSGSGRGRDEGSGPLQVGISIINLRDRQMFPHRHHQYSGGGFSGSRRNRTAAELAVEAEASAFIPRRWRLPPILEEQQRAIRNQGYSDAIAVLAGRTSSIDDEEGTASGESGDGNNRDNNNRLGNRELIEDDHEGSIIARRARNAAAASVAARAAMPRWRQYHGGGSSGGGGGGGGMMDTDQDEESDAEPVVEYTPQGLRRQDLIWAMKKRFIEGNDDEYFHYASVDYNPFFNERPEIY